MGEIIVFIVLIASIIYEGTTNLILNRTLRHLDTAEAEKNPTVLEKKREKAGVKRINRLTERSRKWLEAHEKNGKE